MKTLLRISLALLALVAGCHQGNASRELLERDLRLQENTIYQLSFQLEDMAAEVDHLQRENADLKQRLGTSGGDRAAPAVGAPPRGDQPSEGVNPLRPPEIVPPTVDPGTETPPEEVDPPGDASRAPTGIDVQPVGHRDEHSGDQEATRLEINRRLTVPFVGKYSGQDKPTDSGLSVVFSAAAPDGRPVPAAGDVSIVVVDPELTSAAARVARWDFPADAALAHYRDAADGGSFQFDLTWPNGPPQHPSVQLFVRLTTSQGVKLEANQELNLAAPERSVLRSQPTATDRPAWSPNR